MSDDYARLAADFLAGNKQAEAELRKLERAQVEADALRRRQEAADRFIAEQALAAEQARLTAEREAEQERLLLFRAELGVLQHELDGALEHAARLMADAMRVEAAVFNSDGVETVAAQVRAAIFANVDDPFRRRLLGALGGQWAEARKMAESLGVNA